MADHNKIVMVVHAVDTEGPLYESLDATFERLKEIYDVDTSTIKPTKENLQKLKEGKIDIGGKEALVQQLLNSHAINYNDSWQKIDDMLEQISTEAFRKKRPDSFGGGWVFNWHCLDHVGYDYNPRKRDIGYHNIFDHYLEWIKNSDNKDDAIHWHFHPMSTYKDAHRCATSYVNSPELYQILCRRIIERNWFPTVFRAGFQTERPDSHAFLEQWIPFDISNMSLEDNSELDNAIDFRNGRSGNWRLAPTDWSIYHPHHDDYQLEGNCRRWIGRALNVFSRIASIDQQEIDKAFKQADSGKPALVGIASHDFRDLGAEVEFLTEMINEAQKKYPDVKFKYAEAIEAFRLLAEYDENKHQPIELTLTLNRNPKDDVPNLEVKTTKGKVFGPQPFLAIETISRRFIHDNFDFSVNPGEWNYAFHTDTLPLSDVKRIGVATNDAWGSNFVEVIEVN